MITESQLVDTIVRGIQEKKGHGVCIIDLRQIDGAIAKYFVICEGNSPTQVEAITESVSDMVRTEMGEKPVNVVGLGLSQWVAMDYVDAMVHVFVHDMRQFYDLENLWQDATITDIEDV